MSMQITLDADAVVQLADHGSDEGKILVVIAIDREAALAPVNERAARKAEPADVVRHRAEDALLDASVALINKARRAVQAAEARAVAGQTAEQARQDALAKVDADLQDKAALEVRGASPIKR